MMSERPVLITVEGGIARLTLNRPGAGNTINLALATDLLDAVTRCDEDSSIRCVVITGQGKLFCGGGDISAISGDGASVPEFLEAAANALHAAISRLMHMKKPLLVLVNGPAAGAGLSLALTGDVVISARSAHFTAAYGLVGLSPDGGMSWTLPRLVGMRRAQEMIFTNRRVTSEDAAAIGLVTRVVNDDQLGPEGMKEAERLAASAVTAIGASRALLMDSFGNSLDEQLQRETQSLVRSGQTRECREGLSAFLERRKPDFAGVD